MVELSLIDKLSGGFAAAPAAFGMAGTASRSRPQQPNLLMKESRSPGLPDQQRPPRSLITLNRTALRSDQGTTAEVPTSPMRPRQIKTSLKPQKPKNHRRDLMAAAQPVL